MSFRFPSRLYAIADPCGRNDLDPVALAAALVDGGARLIQLRWKEAPTGRLVEAAGAIRALTRSAGALFLVNDRVDVALAVGADGVHLGQDDLPPEAARRLLGPGRIVGVSTHDEQQAIAAARGADYLGFGPLYGTATKETGYSPRGLEALGRVRTAVRIPIVVIGGVTPDNAAAAIGAGADATAMISALCLASDPAAAARAALSALGE